MQSSLANCRLCRKSTTTSLSDLKKRLSFFSAGAEPVRHIIKSFIRDSFSIEDFTFEEHEFHVGDYICHSCNLLFTNYDKAKKRLEELQEEVKSCLQAIIPATVPPPCEPDSSPIVSPLGRRLPRPGVWTSTPKRLRLEPRELAHERDVSSVERDEARVKVCSCAHAYMHLH